MPRRSGERGEVVIKWHGPAVKRRLQLTMNARVKLATAMLHSQVVRNISKSVGRSGGTITQRSRPGEYPRAETTQLMRTLFWDTDIMFDGSTEGHVGTPLDYGAILEISRRLDRGYLVRTLNENRAKIVAILTAKIK